jgi:acyl-coenzyme A synthetase/AMP-(fatty) acid ligase
MSPRNSGAAVSSMLRKVSAHSLVITSSSVKPLLDDVKREMENDNYGLEVIELPSLIDIYPRLASETEADPFEPVLMAERDAFACGIVMYIHSSGSTGHPKPIPWTHDYLSSVAHAATVKHMRDRPAGTGK